MSDTMNENDYEQDFWEDVDSIRAMLDAEDNKKEKQTQPVTRPSAGAEDFSFSAPRESFGKPDFNYPPVQPASEQNHRVRKPLNYPPAAKMKKPPRNRQADLKAALIILYVILFAECAGLSYLGASWYSWMH